MRDQAQALVRGDGADWDSIPGRRLRAVAALLSIPEDWRTPPYEDVREAYHVARLLARNPKAKLLPGEREALAAVPDAIQYTPVYVGKS